VRRNTYGYLPSRRASPFLDRYQIILLGDRGTCVCEQLAQGLLPDSCKEMTSNLKVGSRHRDLRSRKSNALAARPAGDTQSNWVAADRLRESRLTAVEFVGPVSTCIVSITDVRRVNTAISVGASHHVRPVARYTHVTTMQTTVLRPDLQNSSRFIIRLS